MKNAKLFFIVLCRHKLLNAMPLQHPDTQGEKNCNTPPGFHRAHFMIIFHHSRSVCLVNSPDTLYRIRRQPVGSLPQPYDPKFSLSSADENDPFSPFPPDCLEAIADDLELVFSAVADPSMN
jgi:hypothetical protein